MKFKATRFFSAKIFLGYIAATGLIFTSSALNLYSQTNLDEPTTNQAANKLTNSTTTPETPTTTTKITTEDSADTQPKRNFFSDLSYTLDLGYSYQSLENSLLQQYTGNDNFKTATSTHSFQWLKLGVVKDFNLGVLQAIGLGIEGGRFNETMDSIFSGKIPLNTPYVKYETQNIILGVDFYFLQHFSKENHPFKIYAGLGYGQLTGKIQEDSPNPSFNTSMKGPYAYRKLGFLFLGRHVGFNFAIQFNAANSIQVEADRFDQAADNQKINLNLNGITINLSAIFRL